MLTRINGLNIHYLIEGKGIPCLVPSLAGTVFYERSFSRKLREHLQLIFVELRGNRSPADDVQSLTVESIAEELAKFCDAIGLARAAVIGHSGHGIIASQFAARHPERVSHLILVGSIPKWDAEFEAERQRYWQMLASPERQEILKRNEERLAREMPKLSPGAAITRQYVALAPMLWRDPNYDSTDLWADTALNREVWDRFWGEGGQLRSFDAAREFPKIKCPVLIATGLFDFAVPPTSWHGIKEALANHTYHLFENAGHNPQIEDQARFDSALIEWLRLKAV